MNKKTNYIVLLILFILSLSVLGFVVFGGSTGYGNTMPTNSFSTYHLAGTEETSGNVEIFEDENGSNKRTYDIIQISEKNNEFKEYLPHKIAFSIFSNVEGSVQFKIRVNGADCTAEPVIKTLDKNKSIDIEVAIDADKFKDNTVNVVEIVFINNNLEFCVHSTKFYY